MDGPGVGKELGSGCHVDNGHLAGLDLSHPVPVPVIPVARIAHVAEDFALVGIQAHVQHVLVGMAASASVHHPQGALVDALAASEHRQAVAVLQATWVVPVVRPFRGCSLDLFARIGEFQGGLPTGRTGQRPGEFRILEDLVGVLVGRHAAVLPHATRPLAELRPASTVAHAWVGAIYVDGVHREIEYAVVAAALGEVRVLVVRIYLRAQLAEMLHAFDNRPHGRYVHPIVASGGLVGRAIAVESVGDKGAHHASGIVVEPIHELIAALVVEDFGHPHQAHLGVRLIRVCCTVHGPLHPDGEEVLLNEAADVLVGLDISIAL